MKQIKYFYAKPVEEVLLVFDDYSRVRLNRDDIIQLEKVIQEIKQLYDEGKGENTVLNQESVLKVQAKSPLGKI
jgi:hypothetical protein